LLTSKKNKILVYLNSEFITLGLVKSLKQLHNCELYAIVDCNNDVKQFFEKQNFVKFEKIWFYRDHVNYNKTEFDLEFLKKFENDYKLQLWQIILNDRFFYSYNEYYTFNYSEILTILSKECKLFQEIFDQVNPDFIIIKLSDLQQNDLLQKLCIAKKIPVLTLVGSRFKNRCYISQHFDGIDEKQSSIENDPKSLEELQNLVRGISKQTSERLDKKGLPTSGPPTFTKRLRIGLKYLTLIRNSQDHFAYKGRNFTNIVTKNISFFLSMNRKKNFLKTHSTNKINYKIPYVYFPLHLEPERIVSIHAPYYGNQLELIKHIAKSIPIDYLLYVKDHPAMSQFGYRKISFYKEILKLHNVKLISESVSSEMLIKNSKLVVTIAGTSGLEASFFGIPTIAFADEMHSALPNVTRIKNLEELPNIINDSLKKTCSLSEINKFTNYFLNNSFEFDLIQLEEKTYSDLWYEGVLDVDISEQKMIQHHTDNQKQYEILAREYVKKIKYFEQIS
jgi:hypothetical protein